MKKTLIEEPTVELLELFDKVSEEARKEKLSGIPINKIHYWWTRKPLITARAIALTSTLDNVDDVKNLIGFKEDSRAYTLTPDFGVYKKKLGQDPSEIKVLDPFAGSGNIIYELKRLGLDCTSSDYNAVAYLIQKATLEYPAKYGTKLAEDFEKYANEIIELTKKEVGEFYNKNDLVYIWSWCVKCPHCEQRLPLMNHSWIDQKKKIGIKFQVTKDKNFTTELVENITTEEGKQYTQKGGKGICISCKNSINYKDIVSDISKRRDRELLAIQTQKPNSRDYRLATNQDKEMYDESAHYLKQKWNEFEKLGIIPSETIHASHRRENNLWHYGIKVWSDYFSDRQLLVLITILKNIKEIERQEICIYCTLMLSKLMNYSTLGIPWDKTTATSKHTLTLRRPSMVFNHAEVNPIAKVAGSLSNHLNSIKNGINDAQKYDKNVRIQLESVTSDSDKKYDLRKNQSYGHSFNNRASFNYWW